MSPPLVNHSSLLQGPPNDEKWYAHEVHCMRRWVVLRTLWQPTSYLYGAYWKSCILLLYVIFGHIHALMRRITCCSEFVKKKKEKEKSLWLRLSEQKNFARLLLGPGAWTMWSVKFLLIGKNHKKRVVIRENWRCGFLNFFLELLISDYIQW